LKKYLNLLLFIGIIFISPLAQDIQHEVGVINIEVPVRVFKGSQFIDDLTINDFELFENDILQKIETVYLINKKAIKKHEGSEIPAPQVSRHFVLMFELTEYLPRVGDSIEYFFNTVLLPEDTVTIVTPGKTYNFKPEAVQKLPRAEIVSQLKGKLRKDTRTGNAEYWSLIDELQDSMSDSDLFLEQRLQNYESTLKRLGNIRHIDEEKMMQFAAFLKDLGGQKNVFLFYQKELIPKIDFRDLVEMETSLQDSPDMIMKLNELFSFYKRDIRFDVAKVKQAFADSSISMHFILLTEQRKNNFANNGMVMREQSEDIFSAFSEMAQATGGLINSSANAVYAFEQAVDASENYYLIYYSPRNYKTDGEFNSIKVVVKNSNYRISHRAGYIAN